ncbi:response regulator [Pseudobacteriovorax antillogorgiicola]|uniref:Response regulator receiver domain-containing protein n=1 Tax=Pseudobacteriovorax antillogorgiicola TaxID=1513793 RepID=A0A1Y6B886_9BACT|nr:response regulator [Pseudobacteriovorax antillogorgiicola]TCS58701.1 response regulator receiver domain-containing protein [Pseudobacteriovorax antillogorgiicola]SME95639.1 Response regulator receiver domain-containing protein [Pseudobacteriovorax antillogorgiicola]
MDIQVIVLDDETELAKIIADIMNLEGISCTWSDDSLLGLELIRRHRPSLVICDVQMPGLSGVEVFQKVQKQSYDCKFFFHTAQTQYPDSYLITIGGVMVFRKPTCIDRLVEVVKTYLQRDVSREQVACSITKAFMK